MEQMLVQRQFPNLKKIKKQLLQKSNNMKPFFKNHWLTFAGVGVGLVAGYLYWHFVGCNSGTCAITSNPRNSTLYGGIMGGLVFSLFKKEQKL